MLLILIDLSYLSLIILFIIIGTVNENTETFAISLFILGLATTETIMGLLIIRAYFLTQQSTSIYAMNKLRL